jgi:arylsulfatase
LARGNRYITPENDPDYAPETFYYTQAISDHAVRFIEDHARQADDAPFFLYVSYTAAHWPMHALEQDIAKYHGRYDAGYDAIRRTRFERMKKLGVIGPEAELSPLPQPWSVIPQDQRAWEIRCMETYAAMIDRMDQGIGRIVDATTAAGLDDNTLILFLQDNGGCAEQLGRRPRRKPVTGVRPMEPDELQTAMIPQRTRDGHPLRMGPGVMPGPADTYIAYGRNWANVSNTPFRRYKSENHEGGISSPLIAHWPAGISREGDIDHQPCHLIDIMPTFVELAGATYPRQHDGHRIQPMEGRSLGPTFTHREPRPDRILMWEHFGNAAIAKGDWKLVRRGSKKSSWELYDLGQDRSELHDLATRFPQQVEELAAQWEYHAWRTRIFPKPD